MSCRRARQRAESVFDFLHVVRPSGLRLPQESSCATVREVFNLRSAVKRHPRVALGASVPLMAFACMLLAWGVARALHYGRVLPGVWVNEFVAAGMAPQELERELARAAKRLNREPVRVHLEGLVFRFEPKQIDARVDLARTSMAAFEAGRDGAFFSQFGWWLSRFFSSYQLGLRVSYDKRKLEQLVEQWERAAISDPPLAGEVRGQGERLILEEPRAGRRIDRTALAKELPEVLGRTSQRALALRTRKVEPRLERRHVQAALEKGQQMVRAATQLVSRDGALVLRFSREELVRALKTRPDFDPPRLEVFFDPDVVESVIERDRDRLEAEPKNASFRVDKNNHVSIIPGRPGTRLEPKLTAEALMQAVYAPSHVGELPVDRDARPELTTEDARALNIEKLVAQFSTRHHCCQPRVQNIHRIADILDGTVVKPGEVFSINERVGPRTTKNGFVPAPTIVEGDMEDTVGGGVSQFATTIFNALLYGGYDIIERQPHSYYFTRYPMGHEATLSYPKPDIIFKNDTKSGLLIKCQYTDTRITVKLFGDNEGRKVKTTVSRRQDIVDPPVELVPDPSMEPDEEKVLAAGSIGWSVIAGRIITFKDKTQKVEKRKVTYMPRVRRVRVHPCRIPEGEEGYTGEDCPEPEDVEMEDPGEHTESEAPAERHEQVSEREEP